VTEPPDDNPEDFDPELLDELSDFLASEQFAELEDDMLLDQIGRGDDNRTIYDELPDEEEDLRDDLFDAQEAILETPIPDLLSIEDAAKAIAEGKKAYEERKAAEKRTQGEVEDKMAISDDAQQVAQIANDETASQAMEGAIGALNDAIGSLNAATTQLSTAAQNLQAAGDSASGQATQAGNLLGGDGGQSISAQGQALGQAISDALSKIAQIDIGEAMQNLQGVDLAQLQGQIQALRDAIKAAAQKHQ